MYKLDIRKPYQNILQYFDDGFNVNFRAGILYMLSSPSHRLPMRVLPLINGACQGARRVYNITRPHTFQIQIGATTLLLAAPDEYVASEWLQVLVHAASKVSHRLHFKYLFRSYLNLILF